MRNTQNKEITPIDCEEAARRFNDIIDNFIKGTAREELVQHLADCRHCFERIEFEQMLKTKISSLGKGTASNPETAKNQIDEILSKIFVS
jgi:hypothetical protein